MSFRDVRPIIASIFLTAFSFVLIHPAVAFENRAPLDSRSIGGAFLGEALTYNVGFWVFDSVAEAKMTITKDPDGVYVAMLHVYTTGFVDKAFMHREDRYISRMREAEDGKRFVAMSFEKTIDFRGSVKRTVTSFDYEKGLMSWQGFVNGGLKTKGEIMMPEGRFYDDPLSAFYNFRFGAYGPVAHGRTYQIFTFPKEDSVPEIYLRVAPEGEGRSGMDGFLAFVRIDKEVFGSTSGEIELFFDKGMFPADVLARDILFFGDVRGALIGKGQ
jgi:hypothetical protein